MSSRVLARFVSRRFLSSAKFLSEEEKAAENIYIKGPNPVEKPKTAAEHSGSRTVIYRDAAFITVCYALFSGLNVLGLHLELKKKQEEVQD